jgi:hypothetical protein
MHRSRSFSLQLHSRIAEHLRERPELVERARQRVESEVYASTHSEYAERWRTLLRGPLDDLLQTLTAETDDAQAMRQTSPLTFVLSTRERYAIWKATRQNDPRAA